MATEVYEVVDIKLQDGTELSLRPLNIKNLRAVMKAWKKAEKVSAEDDFIDVLVECTAITFRQFLPEFADDKEKVEEIVDIKTIYKILKVAADIDLEVLNDPNLVATAQELAGKS